VKHFCHWSIKDTKKRKGIFGDAGPQTSFGCVTADDQGNAYAGGANSGIYVWAGRTLAQVLKIHDGGFVGALAWNSGRLYSGGRDGKVCVTDTSTMECLQSIDFGALPRAIDAQGSIIVVGLRSGSIVECDVETEELVTLMESHNDGEVWGLASDGSYIYTSGDDNQVKKWDAYVR